MIIKRTHILIECPFGNYLIQNVMKIKSEERNIKIFNFIAGDFTRLSLQKFSSNVIEKNLESSQAASQIEQIFKGTHFVDDQDLVCKLGYQSRNQATRVNYIVQCLAPHQYGNYVL